MPNQLDSQLLGQLEGCKELPAAPAIATKIIELSTQANTDLDTLASIVALDPALSAKILGIANSSYMPSIAADAIEQAVGTFGWTGALNIALSFAVEGSIRGTLSSGLNYDYFWLRSLAAATAARALGQLINCKNSEVLFLPGLLQDIGMLALDKALPDLYLNLGDLRQDHIYIQRLEQEKLNADHAVVGERLLANWGILTDVTRLVGLSHEAHCAVEDENFMRRQKCIYLSGFLADCIIVDKERKGFEALALLMGKEMNVSRTNLISLLSHVAGQFQEMAGLFNLDIPNIENIQSVAELSSLMSLCDS